MNASMAIVPMSLRVRRRIRVYLRRSQRCGVGVRCAGCPETVSVAPRASGSSVAPHHRRISMTALTEVVAASGRARGGKGARRRPAGAVRVWLIALAALVVAMVAVGGATRLTGSGLSITEWRPVTGAVPPLSPEAWETEFAKYRASPQYELLNRGMSLEEFKTIYAWEWGHRQLGRLIGVAVFAPLAWFWWRGRLGGKLALTLLALGALGG